MPSDTNPFLSEPIDWANAESRPFAAPAAPPVGQLPIGVAAG